jgi:PPOX class probable F420-dependent enzyme
MTFEELAQERYISLTTFRKDGTPVSTPVWVAGEEGELLVWTAADSWKVKRIKRDNHVRIAPCTARGKPRGEALDGMAQILQDSTHVEELERKKYGWRMTVIAALTRFGRFVKREPAPESVMLKIVPSPEPGPGSVAAT